MFPCPFRSYIHSILAVSNLFAHYNISQISYCRHISLQSAAVNCSISGNVTPFGVALILLTMVHEKGPLSLLALLWEFFFSLISVKSVTFLHTKMWLKTLVPKWWQTVSVLLFSLHFEVGSVLFVPASYYTQKVYCERHGKVTLIDFPFCLEKLYSSFPSRVCSFV